jgi:hypothetical protein
MSIGKFDFDYHFPTTEEQEVLAYVEKRRSQMNTQYRKELITTAKWARNEYDSIPEERLDNLDLFKTGLSRAVVNHRLVMMYDNPSETVYKTVEDSDNRKLEIYKVLDKYDKNVSAYDAIKQELDRKAEIEGISLGGIKWHERIENGVTIGKFSTITEPIDIEDFYWDEAGINLNGYGSFVCNDTIHRKIISLTRFRDEYSGEKYTNVESVRPSSNITPDDTTWDDKWIDGETGNTWKDGIWNSTADFVMVTTYKAKKIMQDGKFVDKEFIIANGQVIYDGEMDEPYICGEKWLPYVKLVGIPTGNFGGMGIPVLIRHPQEALDRMLTMAEAQAELSVNPVLFYSANSELLPDNIEYYAGAAYPYKGTGNGLTNDLQFLKQPDISQGASYIIDKMMQFITIISGVDIQSLISSGELATQTQNKAEVQEKLLKMSMLWNERHGLYDLAMIRLGYIQTYYPQKRIERIIKPNGTIIEESKYPEVGVDDYKVQSVNIKNKKIKRLVPQKGAYSKISITPDDIQIGIDISIESSHADSGANTVKQNKWDKMLDSIARIPGSDQFTDPQEMIKNTIKFAGFKQSDIMPRSLQDVEDDQHPARKEFKAILVSEQIPFNPIMPEDYKPMDYLMVFRQLMKLPEYEKANAVVKKLMMERLSFHSLNYADPYFEDKQKQNNVAQQQGQMQEDQMRGQTLKPIGGSDEPPTTLMGRVKSKAASIGWENNKAK